MLAASVRVPKHVAMRGKPLALTADQAMTRTAMAIASTAKLVFRMLPLLMLATAANAQCHREGDPIH